MAQSPGNVSSNLELWLKADAGTNTTTNGGGITSWTDQSTGGNNATGTGNATYLTSFANFNPGINFTNDAQPISGSITRPIGTASTIFIVGEIPTVADKCLIELGTGSNRAFFIDRRYAGNNIFSGLQTNAKSVWCVSDPGGTTTATVYEDGTSIATQAKNFNTNWTTGAAYYLGDDRSGGNRLTGEIGEVIYYDQQLSAADQVKVQSYLAIKYGITLDNTGGGTAGDYQASDASILWDASVNATYHNDVTGIGRDDNSGLDQRKSISANGDIVIMDKGAAFGTDKDFVFWGNDNGTISTQPSGHPSFLYELNRVWTTKLSGTPGNVTVSFVFPANDGNAANYALFYDTDTDFSNGTAHTTGAAISGDTITFTNVPVSNTFYFTLGSVNNVPGPGNISANLSLWLKANTGTNTTTNGAGITSWADQSLGANNATGTGNATYLSAFANYNPGISFTDDTQPISGSISRTNGTASTIYVVGEIPVVADKCLIEIGTGSSRAFFIDQRYAGNTAFSLQTGGKKVWGVSDPGGTTNALIYENGNNIATQTKVFNTSWTTGATYYLGDDRSGGNRLTGEMSEVVFYDQQLTASERTKVETYLAIKYGITLDNTGGGTAGDYTATDGTILWDASVNPTYHNDVIAICRDDAEVLYQKQSNSVDDSIRLFVGSLATDNASNTGTIGTSNSSIIIGNNQGKLQGITTEKPAGVYSRFEREWKVTNTNFTDSYSIAVKWDSIGNFNINDIRLLVDDDGDFTNATVLSSVDGLTFSVGSIIVGGINTSHIPANSTRYVTIASASISTPLPIELMSFSARNIGDYAVELIWQTASEKNNEFFTVERSGNGYDWQAIDTLKGAGNSSAILNYRATDTNPYPGISYYRLKQTDFDGQFEYSKTISISIDKFNDSRLHVYPNPADNKITIEGSDYNLQHIRIFNMLSQDVSALTSIIANQKNSIIIDLSALSRGAYYIKANTITRKVYKQ